MITSISFDHTRILGETLAEIAAEKGGIIKPERPVVSAAQQPEAAETLQRIAHERGCDLLMGGVDWQATGTSASFDLHGPWGDYGDLASALVGRHQVENAAIAVAACWVLDRDGFAISRSRDSDRAGECELAGTLRALADRPDRDRRWRPQRRFRAATGRDVG